MKKIISKNKNTWCDFNINEMPCPVLQKKDIHIYVNDKELRLGTISGIYAGLVNDKGLAHGYGKWESHDCSFFCVGEWEDEICILGTARMPIHIHNATWIYEGDYKQKKRHGLGLIRELDAELSEKVVACWYEDKLVEVYHDSLQKTQANWFDSFEVSAKAIKYQLTWCLWPDRFERNALSPGELRLYKTQSLPSDVWILKYAFLDQNLQKISRKIEVEKMQFDDDSVKELIIANLRLSNLQSVFLDFDKDHLMQCSLGDDAYYQGETQKKSPHGFGVAIYRYTYGEEFQELKYAGQWEVGKLTIFFALECQGEKIIQTFFSEVFDYLEKKVCEKIEKAMALSYPTLSILSNIFKLEVVCDVRDQKYIFYNKCKDFLEELSIIDESNISHDAFKRDIISLASYLNFILTYIELEFTERELKEHVENIEDSLNKFYSKCQAVFQKNETLNFADQQLLEATPCTIDPPETSRRAKEEPTQELTSEKIKNDDKEPFFSSEEDLWDDFSVDDMPNPIEQIKDAFIYQKDKELFLQGIPGVYTGIVNEKGLAYGYGWWQAHNGGFFCLGEWEDDKCVLGKVRISIQDSWIYEGNWKQERRHGLGMIGELGADFSEKAFTSWYEDKLVEIYYDTLPNLGSAWYADFDLSTKAIKHKLTWCLSSEKFKENKILPNEIRLYEELFETNIEDGVKKSWRINYAYETCGIKKQRSKESDEPFTDEKIRAIILQDNQSIKSIFLEAGKNNNLKGTSLGENAYYRGEMQGKAPYGFGVAIYKYGYREKVQTLKYAGLWESGKLTFAFELETNTQENIFFNKMIEQIWVPLLERLEKINKIPNKIFPVLVSFKFGRAFDEVQDKEITLHEKNIAFLEALSNLSNIDEYVDLKEDILSLKSYLYFISKHIKNDLHDGNLKKHVEKIEKEITTFSRSCEHVILLIKKVLNESTIKLMNSMEESIENMTDRHPLKESQGILINQIRKKYEEKPYSLIAHVEKMFIVLSGYKIEIKKEKEINATVLLKNIYENHSIYISRYLENGRYSYTQIAKSFENYLEDFQELYCFLLDCQYQISIESGLDNPFDNKHGIFTKGTLKIRGEWSHFREEQKLYMAIYKTIHENFSNLGKLNIQNCWRGILDIVKRYLDILCEQMPFLNSVQSILNMIEQDVYSEQEINSINLRRSLMGLLHYCVQVPKAILKSQAVLQLSAEKHKSMYSVIIQSQLGGVRTGAGPNFAKDYMPTYALFFESFFAANKKLSEIHDENIAKNFQAILSGIVSHLPTRSVAQFQDIPCYYYFNNQHDNKNQGFHFYYHEEKKQHYSRIQLFYGCSAEGTSLIHEVDWILSKKLQQFLQNIQEETQKTEIASNAYISLTEEVKETIATFVKRHWPQPKPRDYNIFYTNFSRFLNTISNLLQMIDKLREKQPAQELFLSLLSKLLEEILCIDPNQIKSKDSTTTRSKFWTQPHISSYWMQINANMLSTLSIAISSLLIPWFRPNKFNSQELTKQFRDIRALFVEVMNSSNYEQTITTLDNLANTVQSKARLRPITLEQAIKNFRYQVGTSLLNSLPCPEDLKQAYTTYHDFFQKRLNEILNFLAQKDILSILDKRIEKEKIKEEKIDKTLDKIIQEQLGEKLRNDLKKAKGAYFDLSDPHHRQIILPQLLACLVLVFVLRLKANHAALRTFVYSDLQAKNNIELLQPWSIQIITIFCLLGVENNKYDEKNQFISRRLVQILTGQGKSWALALTAGLLALKGIHVDVVCHSEDLISRDKNFFKEIFSLDKDLCKLVKYKTVQQLLAERMEVDLVRDKLWSIILGKQLRVDNENSHNGTKALLLDEVDLFFGNLVYQVEHFKLASVEHVFFCDLKKLIWWFSQLENKREVIHKKIKGKLPWLIKEYHRELQHLLTKKCYALLSYFIDIEITNYRAISQKIVYIQHDVLKENIQHSVLKGNISHNLYWLNKDKKCAGIQIAESGLYRCKNNNESYTVLKEQNVYYYFEYFKKFKIIPSSLNDFIKPSAPSWFQYLMSFIRDSSQYWPLKDFDLRTATNACNFYANDFPKNLHYGYSDLLDDYEIVLGVSGTLSDLCPEQHTVLLKQYNIADKFYSPPGFGSQSSGNILFFNKIANFIITDNQKSWHEYLLERIQQCQREGISAVFFFEPEGRSEQLRIIKFMRYLAVQLQNNRTLDVIKNACWFSTEVDFILDSEPETKFGTSQPLEKILNMINESEEAMIVFLESRYGRGTDFKGSGNWHGNGLHIVQTFFSIDPTEEKHIKARTARRDENGSYELVLERSRLQQQFPKLKLNQTPNYDSLDLARTKLIKKKFLQVEDNLDYCQRETKFTSYLSHQIKLCDGTHMSRERIISALLAGISNAPNVLTMKKDYRKKQKDAKKCKQIHENSYDFTHEELRILHGNTKNLREWTRQIEHFHSLMNNDEGLPLFNLELSRKYFDSMLKTITDKTISPELVRKALKIITVYIEILDEKIQQTAIFTKKASHPPIFLQTKQFPTLKKKATYSKQWPVEVDSIEAESRFVNETRYVALRSQRIINKVIVNGETIPSITIEVEPDGNCGFTATKYALRVYGKKKLADTITRKGFIIMVKKALDELHNVSQISAFRKEKLTQLLQDIYQLSNIEFNLTESNFIVWKDTFSSSNEWANDTHFKLMSYVHNIRFEFYVIDHENNNSLIPRGGQIGYGSVIDETNAQEETVIVRLLNNAADKVNMSAIDPNNHFDLLFFNPDEELQNTIKTLGYIITSEHVAISHNPSKSDKVKNLLVLTDSPIHSSIKNINKAPKNSVSQLAPSLNKDELNKLFPNWEDETQWFKATGFMYTYMSLKKNQRIQFKHDFEGAQTYFMTLKLSLIQQKKYGSVKEDAFEKILNYLDIVLADKLEINSSQRCKISQFF